MQSLKGFAMVGLGMIVASIILSFSLKATAQPGAGAQAAQWIGRFRLETNHQEKAYVIDTVTGRVWDRSATSGGDFAFYNPKR